MNPMHSLRWVTVLLLAVAGQGAPLAAQRDAGLPIRPARTITFPTDEGTGMSVDVSPDGRTLVFDLLGDLYTLPMTGGTATRLTHGLAWDMAPRFSPEGHWIAFSSDRSGTRNIWVVGRDGSGLRPVTRDTVVEALEPLAWYPSGRALLVHWGKNREESTLWRTDVASGARIPVADAHSNPYSGDISTDGKLLTFAVRGEQDTLVFQDLRSDAITLVAAAKHVYGPRLSPDGRWLAYVEQHRVGLDDDVKGVLRVANVIGGRFRLLRTLALLEATPYQRGRFFPGYAFTPDSRAIVVASGGKLRRIDVGTGTMTDIPFVAHVRSELGPLVKHSIALDDGVVPVRALKGVVTSPDGSRLAFSAVGRIWVTVPGGAPRRLSTMPEDGVTREYDPAFSPDGRWIAFVTWSDTAGGRLWKIPAQGGHAVPLTGDPRTTALSYASPRWTPDGERLVVATNSVQRWLAGQDTLHPPDLEDLYTTRVHWLTADGDALNLVPTGSDLVDSHTLTVSRDGRRVFYNADFWPVKRLRSVPLDGGAAPRSEVRMVGRSAIRRIVASPLGDWAAVESYTNDLYLLPLEMSPNVLRSSSGLTVDSVRLDGLGGTNDPRLIRLSRRGGDPSWSPDGRWLTWSLGDTIFRLALREVLASAARHRPQAWPIRLTMPRLASSDTLVLRGARVITMAASGIRRAVTDSDTTYVTDPGVIERGDIVVGGRRIIAVGPTGTVPLPAGVKVLELEGKTIVPGLIGLHDEPEPYNFLTTPDLMPGYASGLAYGLTTMRHPGGLAELPGRAELLASGQLFGPRAFSAVSVIYARTGQEVASPSVAGDIARKYRALGATVLKQYVQPHRIQRQWLNQAAAQAGMNATVEPDWLNVTNVLDGYAGIEHNVWFPHTHLYRDVVQLVARSGTTITSTHVGASNSHWYDLLEPGWDAQQRRLFPGMGDPPVSDPRFRIEHDYGDVLYARQLRDILRAGGNVAVGGHDDPGSSTISELLVLPYGGMTNAEALRCITLNGARGLGMEADLGSIEVGKIADLVVLRGNPLEHLRHIAAIDYVIKDGIVYDGPTLNTIWPIERTFPRLPWQPKVDDRAPRIPFHDN